MQCNDDFLAVSGMGFKTSSAKKMPYLKMGCIIKIPSDASKCTPFYDQLSRQL